MTVGKVETLQKAFVFKGLVISDQIAKIRDLPLGDTDIRRICFVKPCFSTLDPCTYQMAISLAPQRIGMVLYTRSWRSTTVVQEIQPDRQKYRWLISHQPKSSSR